MTERLSKLSPERVTWLIEENRSELCLRAARLCGSRVHEGETMSWVVTTHSAWPNSAFRARLTEANADAVIAEWRAQADQGLAPRRVMFAEPSPVRPLLAARGLRKSADRAAMSIDFSRATDPYPRMPGCTIAEVHDNEALEHWTRILGTAMFGLHVGEEVFASVMDDDAFRLYLASVDGVPAATSLLFAAKGMAGIHQVSTLPEFRGRGLGTRVTIAAMNGAREMGYEDATLFSSEMGESIYRRIGFRERGRISVHALG